MKKSKKSTFFIVVALILVFTYVSFFGIFTYYGDNKVTYIKGANDIRWGIDIQGGVEAVFTPDIDVKNITSEQMDKAEQIIKVRLINNNITDYEIDTDDDNKQIIVRFPWQTDEKDFDPAAAVDELGSMAVLTFREGTEATGDLILEGSKDVASARSSANQEDQGQYLVQLNLTNHGRSKFKEATSRLVGQQISIWLDDKMISAPSVESAIDSKTAQITGTFTAEEANDLANTINAGSLPFALSVDSSKLNIISPSLGASSLNVMLNAGIAAFILIVLMMILMYRLPGVVASLALTCQLSGIIACISGFFSFIDSFTLTIPGIAGIILSIGMGVDANVINNERVKEELKTGKTIDGSIKAGYKRGFGAILDGNVTVIIVSIVLMGAFGPQSTLWAKIVSPLMFMFSSSITGSIYSFGYTLLIGAIFNLIIGVALSKVMIKSLAAFRCFKNPWLFGGVKDAKNN